MHTTLRPGDYLYRLKNFVLHVGVYLDNDRVLHHLPGRGIIVTSISHFSEGKRVTYKSNNLSLNELHKKRLIELLEKERKYHAVFNNCEHTASYFTHGKPKSPQIRNTVAGMAIGSILGAVYGKKGALYGALIAGGIGFLSARNRSSHKHINELEHSNADSPRLLS